MLRAGGRRGRELARPQAVFVLRRGGYPEKNLNVRIESWAEHNEEAWSRMTPHWLRFLFGRPQLAESDPDARHKAL